MFEIALATYSYAKRTWWCLSSLTQQLDPPRFSIRLNLHERDPFASLNRRLVRTFENSLDLKVVEWSDETFFKRGNNRNADLQNAIGEWLLFLDPDSVLDPRLLNELATADLEPGKVNVAPRTTMTYFDVGYQLVDAETYEDRPVADAAAKCAAVGCLRKGRRGRAGYFHLIHPATIKHLGHQYANGRRDTRFDTPGRFSTPSDRSLRSRVGMQQLLDLPPLYHLQHWRRQQAGCPEWVRGTCH